MSVSLRNPLSSVGSLPGPEFLVMSAEVLRPSGDLQSPQTMQTAAGTATRYVVKVGAEHQLMTPSRLLEDSSPIKIVFLWEMSSITQVFCHEQN